jgi:hypothetical protein
MQIKNTISVRRCFKHNFILVMYENKIYDKENVPKIKVE